MYVRTLRIENLRCFEKAEVDLQFPGREQEAPPPLPNVNLLLGNNGAGKTTVLKAVALGVLGQVLPASGFKPYHLVRRSARKGGVAVKLTLHQQDFKEDAELDITVDIARIGTLETMDSGSSGPYVSAKEANDLLEALFDEESPAFLLVGYGSTRYVTDASKFEPLSTQLKRRGFRYQRVAGLFEDFVGLSPLISWLPRVSRDRFAEIAALLNELLPREARFLGKLEEDEYLFEHCGVAVPLGALSDGYRAYIGWVSDLLYNLSLSTPKGTSLRDLRGVVLVDEVDLHLHPEWQREVVPQIARTLPNLQFFLTTHSPIVAGTLTSKNIFVLEMDNAGASTIQQYNEPIHGLSADQILVSSYFNLDTPRAPGAVNEMLQLSNKAMSGDSDAALEFLKRLASGTERP